MTIPRPVPEPRGAPPAFSPAAAREVRALIASRMGISPGASRRIGEVTLLPHQEEAALRLRQLLRDHRGALLADDAGLGKTFTALAIAAEYGGALVVAPAALRAMWRESARRAAVPIAFVSVEALSRSRPIPDGFTFLIVDEAHHLRNSRTRRWEHLARACAGARILLLSATPVHNARRELEGQLSLFLGERASAMSDPGLAAMVVRRTRDSLAADSRLPELDGPHWIEVDARDESLLEEILALPAPVPPSDGGVAGALLQWTLVRQWSSSRAALAGAVRRRLARAIAMRESLERGIHPSRRELDAWRCADGAMQLAFPELLASGRAEDDHGSLLVAVTAHEGALEHLLRRMASCGDPDPGRARALSALRDRHPGATIVAFAERAETIERLWTLLRGSNGVAMLTAGGGRVAGGQVSRRDLLARVAPRAQGVAPPSRAERISLLLTTDLLSEGINLQDASVVVHLDLPWSPARMEQRVGRARRLGSPHLIVSAYALRPPAASERLLDIERRLKDKLALAGRLVGLTGSILPGLSPEPCPSTPERWTVILDELRAWSAPGPSPAAARPLVATIASPERGALALVERRSGSRKLVALDEALQLRTDAPAVAHAVSLATAREAAASDELSLEVLRRLDRGLARGHVAGSIGAGAIASRLQRALATSIDRALAALPRHERAALLPVALRARALVHAITSAGTERVLDALLTAPSTPAARLRALAALAETSGCAPDSRGPDEDEERVTALLVLRPTLPPSPA